MKLIFLNSSVDLADAFIKVEGCNFLTIGFPACQGDFMWFVDGKTGCFSKCHAYLKYEDVPENAGIFKINENSAQLYWHVGDSALIKKQFAKSTGKAIENISLLTVAEPEAEAEAEESEVLDVPIITNDTPPDSFFDCNKQTYEDIFKNYDENVELSQLIPGSKWANVTDENYVFGIIYDEDNIPLYLCYGFPLPWCETPPEKLEGYCQWIPVDFLSPHDDGYWVIYINAKTGERVR